MRAPLTQSERASTALSSFYATSLEQILTRHLSDDPLARALSLFHEVATSVPAYARFLAGHQVAPGSVTSLEAFGRLPTPTKDSYYRQHPLPDLCRHGQLERSDFAAVSSGSTGEPAIWPRFVSDELGTAERFEQVLGDAFRAR